MSQMLSLKLKPRYEDNPIRSWYVGIPSTIGREIGYWCCGLVWCQVYLHTNLCCIGEKLRMRWWAIVYSWPKVQLRHLNWTWAIVLLPVCRNTITWLRNKTKIGIMVRFDDNLKFHEVIFKLFQCSF